MGDDGRQERFERLWAGCEQRVHAYALRRTDAQTAQDVVADTFLVAWRRLDVVPAGAELPWLLGVARRVLANTARGGRRREALHEQLAAQPPAETAAGDDPPLRSALAALPERDREALLLVAWDGLSPAEAAAALGCTTGAFHVRAHRARRRLAALLADPSTELMEVS